MVSESEAWEVEGWSVNLRVNLAKNNCVVSILSDNLYARTLDISIERKQHVKYCACSAAAQPPERSVLQFFFISASDRSGAYISVMETREMKRWTT